jgi:Carboxypeptidase regulatory-like domain
MIRIALLLAACTLQAQNLPNASVSGVVRDAVTGQPLAKYNVSTYVNATWGNNTLYTSPTTKQVNSVSDEQGHYKLSDLPAGTYRIQAASAESFGVSMTKVVNVSGQDIEGIDFRFKVEGSITGRIVDEYKEPVPGMTVYLISPEYYGGELGYFIKNQTRTDDRGQYKLARVLPEHTYVVMAEQRPQRMPPHSTVPLDPKLRRRVAMRTFYPNATSKESAALVNVRPGERREGVDIEVKRSLNYCLDAQLFGPMGAGEFNFRVEGAQPSAGMSSNGGMSGGAPQGSTGPDGKLRVCDLAPGIYRLGATEKTPNLNQNSFRTTALVTIVDQDVQLKLGLTSGPVLTGEVMWDGEPPAEPVKGRANIVLTPLLRPGELGERPGDRSEIPGTFSLKDMTTGEYAVRVMMNIPGLYVKDIRYAGHSIMYQPLRAGDTAGTGMQVAIARDGATISARVTNKDGAPVPDVSVLIIPSDVSSPAILQAAMATGQTDQTGVYISHLLAPGKYYVVATESLINSTPECIDRIWRDRTMYKETTVAPNGTAQVSLALQ